MTSELGRRVWFTIGALLVYRLGSYIPLPGIDQAALAQLFRSQAGGVFGQGDLFYGGAAGRLAIFALGLMPYLSAAILLQLVSIAVPGLLALPNRGERGRRRLENYTLGLTLALAAFQAFGIAVALESLIPEMLIAYAQVPFYLGGTSLLIVVCTVLDLDAQLKNGAHIRLGGQRP